MSKPIERQVPDPLVKELIAFAQHVRNFFVDWSEPWAVGLREMADELLADIEGRTAAPSGPDVDDPESLARFGLRREGSGRGYFGICCVRCGTPADIHTETQQGAQLAPDWWHCPNGCNIGASVGDTQDPGALGRPEETAKRVRH